MTEIDLILCSHLPLSNFERIYVLIRRMPD
jgi:hypothetical protein